MVETEIETRFGLFPGNTGDGTVVTMPDGLPGFEKCRRYVIITAPTLAPFTCLQGLDESRPSFLALDPKMLIEDFALDLGDADRARLDARKDDSLLWLALVRFEPEVAKVNLRAPVVINPRSMSGVQLIAQESPYSTEHPIPLD
jgi:flagellar assembly factor FliW